MKEESRRPEMSTCKGPSFVAWPGVHSHVCSASQFGAKSPPFRRQPGAPGSPGPCTSGPLATNVGFHNPLDSVICQKGSQHLRCDIWITVLFQRTRVRSSL